MLWKGATSQFLGSKPVEEEGLLRPVESTVPGALEQAEVQTTSPFSVVSFTLLALSIPDPNHCDYRPKVEKLRR